MADQLPLFEPPPPRRPRRPAPPVRRGPDLSGAVVGAARPASGAPTVVHCARAEPGSFVYVGRPTRFGNPWPLPGGAPDDVRDAVIDRYRAWFLDQVAADPAFAAAVRRLAGYDLGCWCAPRACHAQVVLDWLAQNA